MNIKQLNESELELSENGKIVLLIGIVLIVGGIVAASWVLLTQDDKLAALIGVFAAASGVIALVLASNKQIVIRKNSDSTVRQTRLISKQVKQRSFDARQASMVELEVQQRTETDGKGKKDKSIDSVIRLILLNDDKVELDRSSFNGGSKGSQLNGVELTSFSPMKSEAQAIADFLGIPLQVNDLSSLAGAVETFKGIKNKYIDKEKTEIEEIPAAPKTQTAAEVFAAEQVAARIASNAASASVPVAAPIAVTPEATVVAIPHEQVAPQPVVETPQIDGQMVIDPNLIIQPDQINLEPQQTTAVRPVQSPTLVQPAPVIRPQATTQAPQQVFSSVVSPPPVLQAPPSASLPAQAPVVTPPAAVHPQQNTPAHVQSAQQADLSPRQASPPNTVFYPAQPQNTARVSDLNKQ